MLNLLKGFIQTTNGSCDLGCWFRKIIWKKKRKTAICNLFYKRIYFPKGENNYSNRCFLCKQIFK